MMQIPLTEDCSTFSKSYQGLVVPHHMRGGIAHYISAGIPPGRFLQAVICNNLREALGQADDTNRLNLFALVSWFHCEAPSLCWGTPERYEAWLRAYEDAREGKDLEALAAERRGTALGDAYGQVRVLLDPIYRRASQ